MTMRFRIIKEAIQNILASNAGGRYRVVGAQERMVEAEQNLDNGRSIQVFYQSGDFTMPGSMNGSHAHKMTFHVEMNAAKAAEGDLDALSSATNPAQISAAISTFQNASEIADASWDELFDHVFQIIMSPIYMDFMLEPTDENPDGFLVSSRRITNVKKDTPLSWGEYVLVSGGFDIECKIDEFVTGEIGTAMLTEFTQVDIVDDDVECTGVEVEPEQED